jgi:hypothetical protein
MYERKNEPLLSREAFAVRLARHGGAALVVTIIALGIGACGYHWTEGLHPLDATLNAAMILTGMGPVDKLQSPGGKVFAIGYSLFSGVAFLAIAGLLIAPVAHRVLHHLHLDEEDDEDDDGKKS